MTSTLGFTRGLLSTLIVLNILFAGIFAIGLAVTVGFEPQILAGLADDGLPGPPAMVLEALRWVAVLALATCLPAHILLTRLRAMTADIAIGRPFTELGGLRLRVIAWALLAIQIIDLAFGYVGMRYDEATGGAISWSFGLTGWLAVLLLFVLARVFEQGAAMQGELEATV